MAVNKLTRHQGLVLVLAASLALVGQARGGDAGLLHALARLPAVEDAGRAALGGRGSPDAIQRQYDIARDLQEQLVAAQPISRSCRALFHALMSYATAQILQAEGVDRPMPSLTRLGLRQARVARSKIDAGRAQCHPTGATAPRRTSELARPLSGEAFFGRVTAHGPARATTATLYVDGKASQSGRPVNNTVRFLAQQPPGLYDLKVCFGAAHAKGSCSSSNGVWLLPTAAQMAAPEAQRSSRLSAQLSSLGRQFSGYSAYWVHDLRTGQTAGWNSDARFPAASTIKLAVFAAALKRWGPRPERSPIAHDLKALSGWSSNLATNRLLLKLGGSQTGGARIAQAYLGQIGARRSVFTGGYIVGTKRVTPRQSGDVIEEPPLYGTGHITTAHDLARILYLLHATAIGRPLAIRRSGLTVHEARVGIAMLLSSQPVGDNIGLFRSAAGRRLPMAQKNGWLLDARHTAAILYEPDGPKIAVLMTYRPSITLASAKALGKRFLSAIDQGVSSSLARAERVAVHR